MPVLSRRPLQYSCFDPAFDCACVTGLVHSPDVADNVRRVSRLSAAAKCCQKMEDHQAALHAARIRQQLPLSATTAAQGDHPVARGPPSGPATGGLPSCCPCGLCPVSGGAAAGLAAPRRPVCCRPCAAAMAAASAAAGGRRADAPECQRCRRLAWHPAGAVEVCTSMRLDSCRARHSQKSAL